MQSLARFFGTPPQIQAYFFGKTPLHYAAFIGHEVLINLLLENGTDVNVADSLGCTPLHDAAKNGQVKALQLLVQRGAHVNTNDESGAPLHHATLYKELEAIRALATENNFLALAILLREQSQPAAE